MAIYFSSVHISDNNTGKWGSFYALKWGAALLNVHGGVIIDTKMRVLDKDHKPIPGLLAVGNVSGGLYG
ncbi:MAG TPA: FAD-binding protein, partial [Firmicutes bacterium]|nr:FAD-binding protein [Bacillota bacterium]